MTASTDSTLAAEVSRLSLGQLGARIMLEQLEQIEKHEPGARAGSDPEELHKMRVATRRLRVAFGVFEEELAKAGVGELPVEEAKQVADALGGVRDLDVFIEWLDEQGRNPGSGESGAAAIRHVRADRSARRNEARRRMIETLDGPAPVALGNALTTQLEAIGCASFMVPGDGVRKKDRVARAGKRLLERSRKRLVKRGAGLFAPTMGELHSVRIAAKRFRYTCEFVRPALPVSDAALAAAIERATAVQDTLGELHDAHIAEAALLDDAIGAGMGGDGPAAAGIAALAKGQRARAEAALLGFREAWEQVPRRGWLKMRPAAPAEETNDDGAVDR